ncbi:hypothetical protein HAX54_015501, partial [Datura stramonium]|nr:hypothetical protein [Datura stramonium]
GDGGDRWSVSLATIRCLWRSDFDSEDDNHQPSNGPSHVLSRLGLVVPGVTADSTHRRGSDGPSLLPLKRTKSGPYWLGKT